MFYNKLLYDKNGLVSLCKVVAKVCRIAVPWLKPLYSFSSAISLTSCLNAWPIDSGLCGSLCRFREKVSPEFLGNDGSPPISKSLVYFSITQIYPKISTCCSFCGVAPKVNSPSNGLNFACRSPLWLQHVKVSCAYYEIQTFATRIRKYEDCISSFL